MREGEIDIERGGEMRDTNVKKLSKKRNLKLSHLSCSFAALLSTNLLRSCRMKAAAAAAHFKRTDGSFSFLSFFLNQNFFSKKCRKEEKNHQKFKGSSFSRGYFRRFRNVAHRVDVDVTFVQPCQAFFLHF